MSDTTEQPLSIGATAIWLRETIEAFDKLRDTTFPPDSVVYVDADRYHGYGIVSRQSDEVWKGSLAVLLENGNVWWYPIEDCRLSPESESDDWSWWIKRRKGIESEASE